MNLKKGDLARPRYRKGAADYPVDKIVRIDGTRGSMGYVVVFDKIGAHFSDYVVPITDPFEKALYGA